MSNRTFKIGKDNVENVHYIFEIEGELIRRYAGPFKTWAEAFRFKFTYIK